MNISLTKEEMVMLLRMVNIGNWVMFADLDDLNSDPEAVAHRRVLQKLFTAAYKSDMHDIVCFEPSLGEYFETGAFENDYLVYLQEHDTKQIMEEVPDRLAVRDLIEQVGEDAFDSMDELERGIKLEQMAFSYEKEFEQHGLDRLHLLNVNKSKQGNID